jgi:hypothetical protein
MYVRTRGADETGERREINPAAIAVHVTVKCSALQRNMS